MWSLNQLQHEHQLLNQELGRQGPAISALSSTAPPPPPPCPGPSDAPELEKRLLILSSEAYQIKKQTGASLVVQWLRICLPMQGTRVRALVWEDPTCRGATRPVSHSYWACASGACAPKQERPHNERPAHRDEEWPPLSATRESPRTETKTQHSHK